MDAVEPLRQVFQDALEMGDREYAQYALAQRIYTRALSGVPLGDVQTEYGEFLGVFSHGIARESLNGLRPLYMPADLETIDSDVAALDALFVDEPMLSVHWRVIWMVTLCVLSRVGRNGPDYVHMAEILRAERAALRDRIDLARTLYAAAARRAQQQGYLHHAALASARPTS